MSQLLIARTAAAHKLTFAFHPAARERKETKPSAQLDQRQRVVKRRREIFCGVWWKQAAKSEFRFQMILVLIKLLKNLVPQKNSQQKTVQNFLVIFNARNQIFLPAPHLFMLHLVRKFIYLFVLFFFANFLSKFNNQNLWWKIFYFWNFKASKSCLTSQFFVAMFLRNFVIINLGFVPHKTI